jgi:protein TonB
VEGKVLVRVLVDKEGRVVSATVQQSLEPSCDEAAVPAVRATSWSPALKDGKPVEASTSVPVVFRLKNE